MTDDQDAAVASCDQTQASVGFLPVVRHSVVIPAYNAANYLEQCLDSVFPQLGPEDEVIVVDDGSTDNTWTYLNQIGDPRLRCLQNPQNLGIAATRNRALSVAKGDYLHFLDHDDLWPANRMEVVRDLINQQLNGCSVSNDARAQGLAMGDGALPISALPALISGWVMHFYCDSLPELSRKDFSLPAPQSAALPGSVVIRRDVQQQIGLLDTTLTSGEFVDFLASAMALKLPWIKTHHVLFHRRIHGNNHTLHDGQSAQSYLSVIRRHLERQRRQPNDLNCDQACGSFEGQPHGLTADSTAAHPWSSEEGV